MERTIKVTGKGKISEKPDTIRLRTAWKESIGNMMKHAEIIR